MMWCNAASLMAGGGAVYLNFDTESMQNIIKTNGGAFTNLNKVQPLWEVGESLERLHSQSSMGSNAMGWVSAQTEFHVNHFRLVTWQKCDLKAVNHSQGKRSVLVESHHSFRACEKCQCEENNGFTPSHHQHQARIIIFSSSHCTHLLFKKDSLSKEYKSGLHDINLGHDSAGLEDSRTPHSGCP